MQIQNTGQARLFKNPVLEALTKAHPLVIWGMYVPVIGTMLWYSHARLQFSAWRIVLVFVLAMLSWTLFEYLAHRYIFHMISRSKRIQKFAYTLHGNHHHYPRDRQRLFMPPVPSLIISSVLFSVFYLLSGGYAFIFFPGFVLGYLLYASMHYAIHAWAPPFEWLRPVWRNHQMHHYRNEEKGFGVSSPLWDWVFGTMFNLRAEPEDKAKIRELMFSEKEEIS